jgi:hypothetical protein
MSAEFPKQEKAGSNVEELEQSIQQKRQELMSATSDKMGEIVAEIQRLETEKENAINIEETNLPEELSPTVEKDEAESPEAIQDNLEEEQLFKLDNSITQSSDTIRLLKRDLDQAPDMDERDRLNASLQMELLKYNARSKESWGIRVTQAERGVEQAKKLVDEAPEDEKERMAQTNLTPALSILERAKSYSEKRTDVSEF